MFSKRLKALSPTQQSLLLHLYRESVLRRVDRSCTFPPIKDECPILLLRWVLYCQLHLLIPLHSVLQNIQQLLFFPPSWSGAEKVCLKKRSKDTEQSLLLDPHKAPNTSSTAPTSVKESKLHSCEERPTTRELLFPHNCSWMTSSHEAHMALPIPQCARVFDLLSFPASSENCSRYLLQGGFPGKVKENVLRNSVEALVWKVLGSVYSPYMCMWA